MKTSMPTTQLISCLRQRAAFINEQINGAALPPINNLDCSVHMLRIAAQRLEELNAVS